MCTTEHLNPIKQDVEDGDRLRVYDYGDMLFNCEFLNHAPSALAPPDMNNHLHPLLYPTTQTA